jgi:hypothetical protein
VDLRLIASLCKKTVGVRDATHGKESRQSQKLRKQATECIPLLRSIVAWPVPIVLNLVRVSEANKKILPRLSNLR